MTVSRRSSRVLLYSLGAFLGVLGAALPGGLSSRAWADDPPKKPRGDGFRFSTPEG